MLVTDRLIFLELQKSGSTHVRALLQIVLGGHGNERHNPITPELLAQGLPRLGGTRSPWDWYVSLFCFGCEERGPLQNRLRRQAERGRRGARGLRHATGQQGQRSQFASRFTPDEWFENAADVEHFRDWLRALLDPAHALLVNRGYAMSGYAPIGGLMTYRYCRLFLRDSGDLPGWVGGTETLHAHARGSFLLHYQIEQARLLDDLLDVLRALRVPLTEEQLQAMRALRPQNTSTRPLPVAAYYDDETRALVGQRERFIAERHGYTPPA
ncbi:MAG: hypothetical protein J0M20_18115 [Burkholderiales bacterium]|nr:hypothetical protein [Burkholderiales bacterium]